MRRSKLLLTAWIFSFLAVLPVAARVAHPDQQLDNGTGTLSFHNERVRFTVVIENGRLVADKLEAQPGWSKAEGGASSAAVETDADFGLEVMFTGWTAPGRVNNAENPVVLTKKDFTFIGREVKELPDGTQELDLDFKGQETSIRLRLAYQLGVEAFYVRRNLSVNDSEFGHHFLRWFWTRRGAVSGIGSVLKSGGFGQPAAALLDGGGVFFGVEYPAAENHLEIREGRAEILCGQECGRLIGADALTSDWVVEGLTPNAFVKYWFFRYLDEVRVAPLRPFSLYNTWYDLRSPEYPGWSPEKAMSERSALRMVDILRRSMIEKHGITLDAFVLDDGWDVYESDWVLRPEQWPRGLKPLADELKKTGTALGLDPSATALVLEKVYPTRWISLKLFRAGESALLSLDGFETAVWEIYPLLEADRPLLAGAPFDVVSEEGRDHSLRYYGPAGGAKILNPDLLESVTAAGKSVDLGSLSLKEEVEPICVVDVAVQPDAADRSRFSIRLNLSEAAGQAGLAMLLTPDSPSTVGPKPVLSAWLDGRPQTVKTEPQEGRSQWYTVEVRPGKHEILVQGKPGQAGQEWRGKIIVWLVAKQKHPSKEISFRLKAEPRPRPLPPQVWAVGEIRKNVKLGEINIAM